VVDDEMIHPLSKQKLNKKSNTTHWNHESAFALAKYRLAKNRHAKNSSATSYKIRVPKYKNN
jgi:hypothetical protein